MESEQKFEVKMQHKETEDTSKHLYIKAIQNKKRARKRIFDMNGNGAPIKIAFPCNKSARRFKQAKSIK